MSLEIALTVPLSDIIVKSLKISCLIRDPRMRRPSDGGTDSGRGTVQQDGDYEEVKLLPKGLPTREGVQSAISPAKWSPNLCIRLDQYLKKSGATPKR